MILWLFLITIVLTIVLTITLITENYTSYNSYNNDRERKRFRYINKQKRRPRIEQSYD